MLILNFEKLKKLIELQKLEENSTELNFGTLKSELSSFDCTVEEISLF